MLKLNFFKKVTVYYKLKPNSTSTVYYFFTTIIHSKFIFKNWVYHGQVKKDNPVGGKWDFLTPETPNEIGTKVAVLHGKSEGVCPVLSQTQDRYFNISQALVLCLTLIEIIFNMLWYVVQCSNVSWRA